MGPDFGEMLDTPPAARRRYYELLRALTPEQRANKVCGLSRAARDLAAADVKRIHPDADAREFAARLAERLYGPEIAARLHRFG